MSKKTVTMVFPRNVRFAVTHDNVVEYTPGVHEVPIEHADHWYLKSCGVKKHEVADEQPTTDEQPKSDEPTADEQPTTDEQPKSDEPATTPDEKPDPNKKCPCGKSNKLYKNCCGKK